MGKTYDQYCPIAMTLDIIGDRWTLLIIRDLYFGRRRFSDLLAASPGMSTKILSERLKLLESKGLIDRVVYSEHPLRAEYRLTQRGTSLEPVLNAIGEWGLQHLIPAREAEALRVKIDAPRPRRTPQTRRKAGAATLAS